ncbi:MAG: hypothetical protein U1E87_06480 [Alphaproteobacteria bacterium]
MRRALTGAEHLVRRHAKRSDEHGLVELWPTIAREAFGMSVHKDWTRPVDARNVTAEARLGEKIAWQIRAWLDEAAPLFEGGRAIGCGDILVLVRRRDALFFETIRALHRAGLPVAGADRADPRRRGGVPRSRCARAILPLAGGRSGTCRGAQRPVRRLDGRGPHRPSAVTRGLSLAGAQDRRPGTRRRARSSRRASTMRACCVRSSFCSCARRSEEAHRVRGALGRIRAGCHQRRSCRSHSLTSARAQARCGDS